MTASRPYASVVILSYARPHMLAECVRAVSKQTFGSREIIVVDNASARSADIAAIVAASPGVQLLATGGNVGFATGMNIGLRAARGEVVLMTEDDMVLDPDALERLVDADRAATAPSLFSGVIRDYDTGVVWSAGGSHQLDRVYRTSDVHRGESTVDAPALFDTEYITGAYVFGRASLLRTLGGYRDDYFMYWEDVEFCHRARRRGVRLQIVRDAGARHFTPASGVGSELIQYHKVKNMLATYALHAALRDLPMALLRYGVVDTLRAMARRDGVRVRLRAVWWFAANLGRLLRDRVRLRRAPRLSSREGADR